MTEQIKLKKITFTEDIHAIKKDFQLEFPSAITLLVGDNGCGKSTILDAIRSHFKISDESYYKKNYDKLIVETSSDITKSDICYFDAHGMDKKFSATFGEDMMGQIGAMKASSGQGLLIQMKSRKILDAKNKLIILDEPCRGLSIKNQRKFMNFFMNSTISNENQFIISTHSEIFMKMSKIEPFANFSCSLYSVEHGKYMSFDDFYDSQLQAN